uniref:Uncharacterized protein n=1 Tax=Anguilla anguilla TaxID=7936 RepID=A0A0E9QCY6_ANGAN
MFKASTKINLLCKKNRNKALILGIFYWRDIFICQLWGLVDLGFHLATSLLFASSPA